MQSVPDAESRAPPETPRDDVYDLRRVVGADMESIFALLPRLGQPAAASSTRTPAKRLGIYWRSALVALFVVALMIAAAMAFLPEMRRAPKDAARPAPAPIAMMAVPIETNATPPPPRPAPAKHPREHRVAIASPHRATRPEKPASHQRAAPAPPATPASARCRDGDTAWCLHDRALAADHALRDAYADAARAGVRRATLVDIRGDWRRLRKRADNDPAAMIDGYADLTGTLRRLTRERTGR